MIYGTPIRFLARAFVEAQSLKLNIRDAAELADALPLKNLMPIPVQEATLTGIHQRLAFQNDTGWQLLFRGESFDISLHPTDSAGANMQDLSSFIAIAGEILGKLVERFRREGQRIALVQEGLLPQVEKEQMNMIAKHLLRLPPAFSRDLPFEWDWRVAHAVHHDFGSGNELITKMAAIKRLSGEINRVPFDNLRVDLDTSTHHGDIAVRFSATHIQSFLKAALEWNNELGEQLTTLINEATR